jgi:hypothetical protein
MVDELSEEEQNILERQGRLFLIQEEIQRDLASVIARSKWVDKQLANIREDYESLKRKGK